jgi:hypothetical protein
MPSGERTEPAVVRDFPQNGSGEHQPIFHTVESRERSASGGIFLWCSFMAHYVAAEVGSSEARIIRSSRIMEFVQEGRIAESL